MSLIKLHSQANTSLVVRTFTSWSTLGSTRDSLMCVYTSVYCKARQTRL